MLVPPVHLTLGILFPLLRRWWGVGNFCYEESRGCFRNAIDENTEKRDLEEDKEANSKAEEDTLAVTEPRLLLLLGEFDARKVGFKLRRALVK